MKWVDVIAKWLKVDFKAENFKKKRWDLMTTPVLFTGIIIFVLHFSGIGVPGKPQKKNTQDTGINVLVPGVRNAKIAQNKDEAIKNMDEENSSSIRTDFDLEALSGKKAHDDSIKLIRNQQAARQISENMNKEIDDKFGEYERYRGSVPEGNKKQGEIKKRTALSDEMVDREFEKLLQGDSGKPIGKSNHASANDNSVSSISLEPVKMKINNQQISIEAKIMYELKGVGNGSEVPIRLMENTVINGYTLKKGDVVTGIARIENLNGSTRIGVVVQGISIANQLAGIDLLAYDGGDRNKGIRIENGLIDSDYKEQVVNETDNVNGTVGSVIRVIKDITGNKRSKDQNTYYIPAGYVLKLRGK